MTSPRDRYLELALREVVGGRVPPDLTDRILAAAGPRPGGVVRPLWQRLGAAAALLVAAVGGLLLLRMEPEPPVTVAGRGPVAPEAALGAAEREQLVEWVAWLRESINGLNQMVPENRRKVELVVEAQRGIAALLDRQPAAFSDLRPLLTPLPDDPTESDVTFRLLELLFRGPHPSRDPAVLAWLDAHPDRMSPDWLLCLAEDGLDRGAELLADQFAPAEPVYVLQEPAIHFGLRGSPIGRAELETLLAKGWQERFRRPKFAGAAAALHRLGDPVPWRDAVAHARAEVERAAAEGMLDTARTLVANLLYFHPAVAGGGIPPVRGLDRRVAAFARERTGELGTVEQLRMALSAMD